MRRSYFCAIALCAHALSASVVLAQTATSVESTGDIKVPWTIVIRPSARAVAIGNCQLVYIDLTDESGKDSPRRPGGNRVSLADFDWLATGAQPNTAVGMYDGPNSWSVCACQGATVGSPITITATYPARSLPEKVRVPGLAFRSTTALPIIAAYGRSNPRGCAEPTTVPTALAVTGTATPTVSPPLVAPAAGAATGTLLPPPIATLSGSTAAPSARPPASTSTAPGPPPPSGHATPPTNAPEGLPPQSVFVDGSPAEAVVRWSAPPTYNTPAPVEYVVDRTLQSNSNVGQAQSPPLTALVWRDAGVTTGTWIYRVTAIYADGRRGTAGAYFTYPEAKAPPNVHAEQIGRDTVSIAWDSVPGASSYSVTGPGMTSARVDSAHFTKGGIPLGPNTWQVAAVYTGTGGAAASSRVGPAVSVTVDFVRRRYRLVAEALRVTAETVDQQFSADGKYDEVYVAGLAERINRQNGRRIDVSSTQVSAVHGDVSNWPPPQRMKAGSASGNGGIQHGDVVSPIWTKPNAGALFGNSTFILWEGELIGGKQELLLHPMIFEVDQAEYDSARVIAPSGTICDGVVCLWSRYFAGPGATSSALPAVTAAMSAPQISVQDGVQMFLTPSGYFVHLEQQNRDRPIGLVVENNAEPNVGLVGMWRDKVVVLSREKLEAALAAGQNKIQVRFWDHWNLANVPPTTVPYLNGDYTMVIRIERAP